MVPDIADRADEDRVDCGDVEHSAEGRDEQRGAGRRRAAPMLGLTQLSNYLTLRGSFSAVSKPNFENKYALE